MESFTPALKWLNLILTYVYAGLTMACFIMALGNRPKGSKWGYSMAFVTFAISASLFLFCSSRFRPRALADAFRTDVVRQSPST
jgi:hypothetical protein